MIIVGDEAYFALTPEEFQRLALTFADIERWVNEAGWQILYYRGELPDER